MAVKRAQKAKSASIRNRVIDYRLVPASSLSPSPYNWRDHPPEQREYLRAALQERGIAGAVLTRLTADGALELVDGHLRSEELAALGDQPIPALVTDLTAEEAQDEIAAHDAITSLATVRQYRAASLVHLLADRNQQVATLLQHVAAADSAQALLERIRQQRQWESQRVAPSFGDGATTDTEHDNGDDIEHDTDDDLLDVDETLGDEEDEADGEDPSGAQESSSVSAPLAVTPLFRGEQVIDAALAHYRATGFPYHALPVYLCMQEINRLSRMSDAQLLRAYKGTHVADTYHPHRFHVRTVATSAQNSPYDSFCDDALLRRALQLRWDDQQALYDGYPTTLDTVSHTQAAQQFRPGFACYLYRRYAPTLPTGPDHAAAPVILDTSTGYGGRLVGFLASGLIQERGARYIGIDPCRKTHEGNTRLAADMGVSRHVELIHAAAEDVPHARLANTCDLAFTSPPYFSKERYGEEDGDTEAQSWRRYPTAEAWRDGFLRPLLALHYAALKPGAYSLLNIDDVRLGDVTYPLSQWAIEAAADAGFTHVETLTFAVARRNGAGALNTPETAPNSEPVLVFRKPIETLETPHAASGAPFVTGASRQRTPPASLLTWMERLYALSADEASLTGDLGVWPVELRDYLVNLCRAYSPYRDANGHALEAAHLTFASHLLTRLPDLNTPVIRSGRTVPAERALLLFSGGKDSLAAGKLLQERGYVAQAVYVASVNTVYSSSEQEEAEQAAHALGWDFSVIRPRARLPRTRGESVIKNQYALALALETLAQQWRADGLPYPPVIATGSFAIDDCHLSSWYSDWACAYRAFNAAIAHVTHGQSRSEPLLTDDLHSLRVWATLPAEAQRHTASCMLPVYHKPQHRQWNLDAGVPLTSDYDCGSCAKCYLRAVLLADRIGTDLAYPTAYLQRARSKLGEGLTTKLWCHAHPALEALPEHLTAPDGAQYSSSVEYVAEHVYGGALPTKGKPLRHTTLHAREPVVTVLE